MNDEVNKHADGREKQEEQEELRHHSRPLSHFLGLPLLPVEVLGGTGLLVPRGMSLPFFVQYLSMDPLLLYFFLLSEGEARAGAVAGSPASSPGAL